MLEIVKESHLDHGLTPAHVEWLLGRFKDKDKFFVETVDIPENLSPVECGLYGPVMGDAPVPEEKVRYVVRGSRKWATRVIDAPKRPTRKLTVVGGPHTDKACVLFTSYGGPSAPREPGDPDIARFPALIEARDFWKVHALVAEPTPMWIRTDEDVATFMDHVNKGVTDASKHYALNEDTTNGLLLFGLVEYSLTFLQDREVRYVETGKCSIEPQFKEAIQRILRHLEARPNLRTKFENLATTYKRLLLCEEKAKNASRSEPASRST